MSQFDDEMSQKSGHNWKSKFLDKFNEIVAEKGQQMIDENNMCAVHPNQPLVAYIEKDGIFCCQQCLFEGNYDKPIFMTVKARQIQDKIHTLQHEFLEV